MTVYRMAFGSKSEWRFQTSRRGLLKFLSGATLIGGAAATAKSVPEPAEGIVKLATPIEQAQAEALARFGSAWSQLRHELIDVVPWRLYDTVPPDLKPMTGRVYFFQHAVGPGTPLTVTNMQMAGMLPEPNTFQIRRMWMLLYGDRENAEQFAANSMLELQIGQKIYCQAPVLDVCRYGLEAVSLKGEQKNEPGPRCMDFTTAPLVIESGVYFTAKLECDHQRLPLTTVILDGLMARPRQ